MNKSSPTTPTRGVLFVHSATSALCPHVEWAAAGVLGGTPDFAWVPQLAEPGSYRAELSWQAPAGTAAAIAPALRGWEQLRFEATEEPTSCTEGARYSYTPRLGIFHAMTGLHGDVLIPEDRIKAFRVKVALGEVDMDTALDGLLGMAWDSELEPFRHAGEGAPVRWLHQVI
ncbi:DUF3145 domain-containing protein [Aeromicrobium sp.]|uniref:DUF3145 domain-containing protein n=1 Tax=Aeromicrobium sp. TaxID=1871063 RepID=UPI00198CAAC3|nr:DUF3145 domain-containing protein [Aeromicrobium sp.]MBC7630050.1 DUF3145 domain-containing protein [Aeromicrobium sp.]